MSKLYSVHSILIFILCALLPGCNDSGGGASDYKKVKEAVDSVKSSFEAEIGRNIPSLNLLIHTPNANIFVSSASDNGSMITDNTYFRFASNSKNFTAMAILNMQEDGWLNIDSKITENIPASSIPYVPDTAEWSIPNKSSITIKQLLQHSAGVYDVDNDTVPGCGGISYVGYQLTLDAAHQFSSTELVGQVTANNLSYFIPGTDHHYSNTGYTILGEIIARIYTFKSGSGKTCTDYLKEYIYGSSAPVPLNIHFPNLASEVTLPLPSVSGRIFNGTNETVYTDQNMSAHVAEGNGYGTMNDLDKYIRSLMKGENVLTVSSIELMKNEISPGSASYALGCEKISNLGYGHNGCICGYLSYMLYDPVYDTSLVIMMPFTDESTGITSLIKCMKALINAGHAARSALDIPENQ
jgi:D-alanyl-D-alanine carboxypeptidase